MIENAIALIAQTPAASPSMPSEKFTTFITNDEPEHGQRPARVAEVDARRGTAA